MVKTSAGTIRAKDGRKIPLYEYDVARPYYVPGDQLEGKSPNGAFVVADAEMAGRLSSLLEDGKVPEDFTADKTRENWPWEPRI